MHLPCTSVKDVSAKGYVSCMYSTYSVMNFTLWQHPVTLMVTLDILCLKLVKNACLNARFGPGASTCNCFIPMLLNKRFH